MSKLQGHEGHHQTSRREEHRGDGHHGDGDRQSNSSGNAPRGPATFLPMNDHSQDESDRLHAAVEANNVIRGGGIPPSTKDGAMADSLDLAGGPAMSGQYGGIDEVSEKIG